VRLALRNNTASSTTCEIGAIRIGYQYNATVLDYVGYHSFLYNGADTTTGLNDPSSVVNFQPETTIPVQPGTRSATISTGGSKVLTRHYFNRSTSGCTQLWIVPPHTYRIMFDVYFTFKPGYTPADYRLNVPGFGFDTPDFIAQFLTNENGNLLDAKKEIAVVFILTGQNPYQPFDQNGQCSNNNFNPVSISGSNINFISPILGVLAAPVLDIKAKQINQATLIQWTSSGNEITDNYEIFRASEPGQPFVKVGIVNSTNQPGEQNYQFVDKETVTSPVVYYKVKALSADGSEAESKIFELRKTPQHSVQLQLFPNPAQDQLRIAGPSPEDFYTYRAYSQTGALVGTNTFRGFTMLSVSGFANGQYWVEVVNNRTGERLHARFAKQ
jgi:hypothetical protein